MVENEYKSMNELIKENKQLEFNLKNAQEIIKTQENWIEEQNHLVSEIETVMTGHSLVCNGHCCNWHESDLSEILQKYKENEE